MSTVLQRERELYENMWAAPTYAKTSPGEKFVEMFMDMVEMRPEMAHHYTVLDAGCGSGKGALALREREFVVRMMDLTPDGLVPEARDIPFTQAALWEDLRTILPYRIGGKFDYVYCCDVMEHLPTQFVMLAVSRLLEVTRCGVFFNIALTHESWGAFAGEVSLHKTVMPFTWWRDNLKTLGELVECRDLGISGVYLVRAK